MDERLRFLLNRYQASGAPEDEIHYFSEVFRLRPLSWSELRRFATLDTQRATKALRALGFTPRDCEVVGMLGLFGTPAQSVSAVAQALLSHGLDTSIVAGTAIATRAKVACLADSEAATSTLDSVGAWLRSGAIEHVDHAVDHAIAMHSSPIVQERTRLPCAEWGSQVWASSSVGNVAYFLGRRTGRLRVPMADEDGPATQLGAVIRNGISALMGKWTPDPLSAALPHMLDEVGAWLLQKHNAAPRSDSAR